MKKNKYYLVVLVVFLMVSFFTFIALKSVNANEGTNWDVPKIFTGDHLYGYVSLATRSNGYPGVAFAEKVGGYAKLKYATCISGDCATDGGGGISNWNSEMIDYGRNSSSARCGEYASIDFDSSNTPVIQSMCDSYGAQIRMAKYTGTGSETSCINGLGPTYNSNWKCFDIDSPDWYTYSDFVIDSSDNHHVVYQKNGDLYYAYCNSGGCDDAGDFTGNNLIWDTSGDDVENIKIDADSSNNLHLVFTHRYTDPTPPNYIYYDLYYGTCSSNCHIDTNWAFTYIDSTNSGVGYVMYPGDVEVKGSIKGVAYIDGNSLAYAEHVGSGGNCLGSAEWDCWTSSTYTNVKLNTHAVPAIELDISSTNERGIVFGDYSSKDASYYGCTSGCTSEVNWSADDVWTDDANNDYGNLISMEYGSGPKVAFGSYGAYGNIDFYYGEQEGDEPLEEPAIPELPKNNLWKLLVAVLALGLVVGIAFWRKKKIPQEPEKK